MGTIRVFVLDDHELVRLGLQTLFEEFDDIEFVGDAATGDEALRKIDLARPDVAVLDVRLPDGNGIEICREIRSVMPATSCIMLTSYADYEALFAAVMAGASGYVLKEIGGFDLVEAIRTVHAGGSLLDSHVTNWILDRMRNDPTSPALPPLTAQEQIVLDLIAQGLTNRQIAHEMNLAEKTIKNYVSRILSKLRMRRRSEAAAYAARMAERVSLMPHFPSS